MSKGNEAAAGQGERALREVASQPSKQLHTLTIAVRQPAEHELERVQLGYEGITAGEGDRRMPQRRIGWQRRAKEVE